MPRVPPQKSGLMLVTMAAFDLGGVTFENMFRNIYRENDPWIGDLMGIKWL